MNSLTSRQWIAIAVGLLLFTGLFFINRKAPPVQPAVAGGQSSGGQGSAHAGQTKDFMDVLKESEESVSPSDKIFIDRMVAYMTNSADSLHTKLLYRIASTYDSIGQPLAASYYMEQLAKLDNSPAIWCKTGERYLDITELVQPVDKDALITRAEDCFNSALKIDSTNLDARVGLGSSMVEQGANPMAGIGIITGVINKDSNNRAAQIALGRFSIKSAQFARAVYRFHRVMDIDPAFHEGYLYLAQAYEGLGNKREAIANLKKYRTFAPDSAMRVQIDKHISEDLKGDITN